MVWDFPSTQKPKLGSARVASNPEVDRSYADFAGLIPRWKQDSFRLADNPSRIVAIRCNALPWEYNCAHGWP